MTSQTPSEATSTKCSWSAPSSAPENSGSVESPNGTAWKSPKDRDMARFQSGVSSRAPVPVEGRWIFPPAARIRLASSSLSGRWMSVSCVTCQGSFLDLRFAHTAMESPRKAQRSRIGSLAAGEGTSTVPPARSSIAIVKVVPEYSASFSKHVLDCTTRSLTDLLTASSQASLSSLRRSMIRAGRRSWAKCASSCPSAPWPSSTPNSTHSLRASTKKSSWLGDSGLCPRWLITPTRCLILLKSPSKQMLFWEKKGV
mmetsp:Transcript_43651/g.113570  ORF Transcript_43651/g.113570 Transcript_43651/m.113570 type:complete len:256 (+) Transcript_43651:197-964(+)